MAGEAQAVLNGANALSVVFMGHYEAAHPHYTSGVWLTWRSGILVALLPEQEGLVQSLTVEALAADGWQLRRVEKKESA